MVCLKPLSDAQSESGDPDFLEPENFVNRDRNRYLLSLYHKLLNLHEWPVKRFFIRDLLIQRCYYLFHVWFEELI